jgi:hypothetical protein
MGKGKDEEWCKHEGIVFTDNKDKKFRCPECGRRLNLQDADVSIYLKFPPHKKKGWKITKKKGHNRRNHDISSKRNPACC